MPAGTTLRQPKMLALLVLGFSSGLPLFLTSRTLQAWMTVEGVDLTSIGLFSLVALPYSLKVFWAPVVDRFSAPFLGRRRSWLMLTQLGLLLAIAAMALHDPRRGLQLLAFNALMIALFSATQDIAFDAYKVDVRRHRCRDRFGRCGGGIRLPDSVTRDRCVCVRTGGSHGVAYRLSVDGGVHGPGDHDHAAGIGAPGSDRTSRVPFGRGPPPVP